MDHTYNLLDFLRPVLSSLIATSSLLLANIHSPIFLFAGIASMSVPTGSVTQRIVGRIPFIQLSDGNFDQMMSDLAFVERDSFLSELVSLVLGPNNNPDDVVKGTYDETRRRRMSVLWRHTSSKECKGRRGEVIMTYMAIPVTTYVAYQKLTSPPKRPPSGGYQGMTRRYRLTKMLMTIKMYQARNSP